MEDTDLLGSTFARVIAWGFALLVLASIVPTSWKLSAASWLIERTHRGCSDCAEKAPAPGETKEG